MEIILNHLSASEIGPEQLLKLSKASQPGSQPHSQHSSLHEQLFNAEIFRQDVVQTLSGHSRSEKP